MLVAIEGIDGSGKGTITKSLEKLINEQSDFRACSLSFPGYNTTRYGKIAGRYLNGDFGSSADHPLIHGTLFALDRFESRGSILKALDDFDFVLCDRYIPSNLCYSAMMSAESERQSVVDHFVDLEYGFFQMPKPDAIYFLDMPVDFAEKNIAKKAKRDYTDKSADIFESDSKYLAKVRSFYMNELRDTHADSYFEIVNCVFEGKLKPVEELSFSVFQKLLKENKGFNNGK